jgi:hypothetical protein
VILAIWYAGVACKVIAAYRIVGMGRVVRYWAVFLYLASCVAYSAVRLYLIHGYPATRALHQAFYTRSAPIMLALLGVAVLSVFRVNTEKYPNFRVPGTAILVVLTILGGAASLVSRGMLVPAGWTGAVKGAILLERNVLLMMAVILVGTGGVLSWLKELPVRPSARTAAYLLCLEVGFGIAASGFSVVTNHQFRVLDGLIPVIGGLIAGWLWAFHFPQVSDECAEVQVPAIGEYEALTQEQERILTTLVGIRRALWRS